MICVYQVIILLSLWYSFVCGFNLNDLSTGNLNCIWLVFNGTDDNNDIQKVNSLQIPILLVTRVLNKICRATAYIILNTIPHLYILKNRKSVLLNETDSYVAQKSRLKVICLWYDPFIIVNATTNSTSGLEYFIFKTITDEYYDVEYFPTDKKDEEAMEDMLAGLYDAMIGVQWHIQGARNGLDITTPYGTTCVTHFVPKALPLSESAFVFWPFTISLWLSVLGLILILAGLMAFITKQDFVVMLMNVFNIFMAKGINKSVYESISYMLVLITCLVAAHLIDTLYYAGLTNTSQQIKYSKPILNHDDLLNSDTKCYSDTTYVTDMMHASLKPTIRVLADRIIMLDSLPGPPLPDYIECYGGEIVMDTEYVFPHTPRGYTDTSNTRKILRDCYGLFYITVILQSNSPHLERLNVRISQVVEHGLVKAFLNSIKYTRQYFSQFETQRKYFTETTNVYGDIDATITLCKLQGAFYWLLSGYFIAAVVFVLERIKFI